MNVLITGCSTGIGLELTLELARHGYKVYPSMRDLSKQGTLVEAVRRAGLQIEEVLELDVTKEETIRAAVQRIVQRHGSIDVVVNNAGYGIYGFAETCTIEEIQSMFDVNFYGVIRVLQAVLPHMRQQRRGRIVNLSSVSGVRSLPGSGMYAASKFALEGLIEGEVALLDRFGVHVSLVEPGAVATDFLNTLASSVGQRRVENEEKDESYAKYIDALMLGMKARFDAAQPAHEVATVVRTIIESEKPKLRYQTGEVSNRIARDKLSDVDGEFLLNMSRKIIQDVLELQATRAAAQNSSQ